MKKKFVTLGIMMALSMTVAAGCGQKAGNETTAQETDVYKRQGWFRCFPIIFRI